MAEFEQHITSILAVVGVIVWLVRLEGKTIHNEKRLSHLETEVEAMNSGLVKELTEVKQSLARIEGYLKAKSEID